MSSSVDVGRVASDLLSSLNLTLSSCVSLQSLWAGYGQICHVQVASSTPESGQTCSIDERPRSLILKYVAPPNHTTEMIENYDEGHVRKILSYQVEQYFYTQLAPQMPKEIAVASCLTSLEPDATTGTTVAMLLTDLREHFPMAGEKRAQLTRTQTMSALQWLADFHGFWWANMDRIKRDESILPPSLHFARHQTTSVPGKGGVWLNGGYTYLATRRTEYETLQDDLNSEWSLVFGEATTSGGLQLAEKIAAVLSPERQSSLQPYLTLLHGDVKSENLFTTVDGSCTAFYDFQYVGLGYGASDLAKFFTCSVSLNLLVDSATNLSRTTKLRMQKGEESLLRAYLSRLEYRSGKLYDWTIFVRHWETALVDWLRFQASWGFWGNTYWLEARVRSILRDPLWLVWLDSTLDSPSKKT